MGEMVIDEIDTCIILSKSEVTALNRLLSGFASGQNTVAKVSVVLFESSSSIAKVSF